MAQFTPSHTNNNRPSSFWKPHSSSAPRPGGFPARPAGSASRPSGPRPVFQDRKAPMIFVNENIKAPTIIIIDEDGTNVGSFSRKRALEMADEQGKDLVQMRYDQETMTSTVKLLDYGKYMYQKQKDDKEKKKNQKINEMKELKINYAIGENDLLLKMKKAREMLWDGYSVRFLIKLKGREKIYGGKAVEKLQYVKQSLSDCSRPQFEHPKQEMQWYSIVLFTK